MDMCGILDIKKKMERFKLKHYYTLKRYNEIDIECAKYGGCGDREIHCPFKENIDCNTELLVALGEIARVIYDDKNAMDALQQIARANEQKSADEWIV